MCDGIPVFTVGYRLCPHTAEGVRGLSGGLRTRALIAFMKPPPLRTNHIPKASPPNTALRVRFQPVSLRRTQSMAACKWEEAGWPFLCMWSTGPVSTLDSPAGCRKNPLGLLRAKLSSGSSFYQRPAPAETSLCQQRSK